MYRDFSAKSKQNILNLVSQVENEKWSDFTDWVGDRWLDFQSWIGKLNIKNYINNINEYHKKVIDKNNTTSRTIEQIFKAVETIDKEYKSTLSFTNKSLHQWQTYIDQMTEIVNPRNGNFNAQYIADCLEALLHVCENSSVESSLSNYLDYDSKTGKYTYNWSEIEAIFAKDASELSEAEIQILMAILSTMMDENGNIDAENLQRFINSGYTLPNSVTKDDFHESFETLPNGSKVNYYYLQNKSYMSDALKMVSLLYNEACESASVNGMNNNLNNLLLILVENYSVIEWRSVVNPSRDYWSGELYISEKDLDWFNEMCKANISIEYVDVKNGSGLDYYLITSNAANYGNVRTATVDGQIIHRNGPDADGYSDYTIRMYVDCKNNNSDMEAVILNCKAILARYYQEFNIEEVLSDELIMMVAKYAPFGGDLISSLYNFASQTGAIKSGVDGVKSADLNSSGKVSEKSEKGIDIGLNEISRILGIYAKYKKVKANNEQVMQNQEATSEFADVFRMMNNLGIRYNTMTVKYSHTSYHDNGKGINVDSSKDCNKSTNCEITPSDYEFDSSLLRNQYNTIMHTTISDSDFADLEKQVQEYMKTGKITDNSIFANYINEWSDE